MNILLGGDFQEDLQLWDICYHTPGILAICCYQRQHQCPDRKCQRVISEDGRRVLIRTIPSSKETRLVSLLFFPPRRMHHSLTTYERKAELVVTLEAVAKVTKVANKLIASSSARRLEAK